MLINPALVQPVKKEQLQDPNPNPIIQSDASSTPDPFSPSSGCPISPSSESSSSVVDKLCVGESGSDLHLGEKTLAGVVITSGPGEENFNTYEGAFLTKMHAKNHSAFSCIQSDGQEISCFHVDKLETNSVVAKVDCDLFSSDNRSDRGQDDEGDQRGK